MIEFNLFVPPADAQGVAARRAPDFIIVTSSYNSMANGPDKSYFAIQASEEEMTFYKLKYGAENVWIR